MFLDPSETRTERQRMVEQQLVRRGIRDLRVLDAMASVPREWFVPKEARGAAYLDGPLSIGEGQTISQPYMVAVMAELLMLTGDETVLEIGAGSGYGAAVLSLLAARVIAVERLSPLLEQALRRWSALPSPCSDIEGVLGDGTLGWPSRAPFHGISVTAGARTLPAPLLEQLVSEQGRLVIPIGDRWMQMLNVVRRSADGRAVIEKKFPCVFVPLIGKEGWKDQD